jgi:hypothetical protein
MKTEIYCLLNKDHLFLKIFDSITSVLYLDGTHLYNYFFYITVHLFIYLLVLGLELRAYTLSHSTGPFFVMGFFEIGSWELFAQAGFEL